MFEHAWNAIRDHREGDCGGRVHCLRQGPPPHLPLLLPDAVKYDHHFKLSTLYNYAPLP